jgi:hypothetical protein
VRRPTPKAIASAGVVLTLAVAAAAARPVEATGFHARLYWGAWIGSQLTGREAPWDMSTVDAFENGVGKHVSIVHFSSRSRAVLHRLVASLPFQPTR